MKYLFFFFILGLSNQTFAETKFKCEDQIVVRTRIKNPPKEWMVWDTKAEGKNTTKKLISLEVYLGHPGKKNQLIASTIDSNLKWDFHSTEGKQQETIWLCCRYEDTEVILIQRLPRKTKSCTAVAGSNSINCL